LLAKTLGGVQVTATLAGTPDVPTDDSVFALAESLALSGDDTRVYAKTEKHDSNTINTRVNAIEAFTDLALFKKLPILFNFSFLLYKFLSGIQPHHTVGYDLVIRIVKRTSIHAKLLSGSTFTAARNLCWIAQVSDPLVLKG
jgi:hypothetical protein